MSSLYLFGRCILTLTLTLALTLTLILTLLLPLNLPLPLPLPVHCRYDTDGVALFQVKGTSETNTKGESRRGIVVIIACAPSGQYHLWPSDQHHGRYNC